MLRLLYLNIGFSLQTCIATCRHTVISVESILIIMLRHILVFVLVLDLIIFLVRPAVTALTIGDAAVAVLL